MPFLQEISFAARRIFAGFLHPAGTNSRGDRYLNDFFNGDWAPPVKRKSNLRILVVEDEPIVGMLIEDILAEFGCCHVDVAPSVDTALDAMAEERPDFAILDVNLNGARSYPVADFLKSRAIPFIFMSGYGSSALDDAYADTKILQKPFRPVDLESALEDVLARPRLAFGSC
jgi:CheY-like chemotaxis protein